MTIAPVAVGAASSVAAPALAAGTEFAGTVVQHPVVGVGAVLVLASTGTLLPTGRSTLPGYFTVTVSLVYLGAGAALFLLGRSPDVTGAGVVVVWSLAAIVALAGVTLFLLGALAIRQGWFRGPAIIAGGALGVAAGVGLLILRGTEGPITEVDAAIAGLLPFVGAVVGWRGAAAVLSSIRRKRRREGDG